MNQTAPLDAQAHIRMLLPPPAHSPLSAADVLEHLEQVARHNTRTLAQQQPVTYTQRDSRSQPAGRCPPPPAAERVSYFTSGAAPSFAASAFVTAIARRLASPGAPLMVLPAALLAVRYCEVRGTPPTAHTIHRLLAACLYVACKFALDDPPSAAEFARLSSLTGTAELRRLETALLAGVEYRVWDSVATGPATAASMAVRVQALALSGTDEGMPRSANTTPIPVGEDGDSVSSSLASTATFTVRTMSLAVATGLSRAMSIHSEQPAAP